MDVRCGQCGTDYDFDDALLSSRGTMVRCTTCGHQFKVFPAHVAGGVADRWLIEKTSGQQLVFTSLKDLQRAIGAGVVRRQDVLTHGGEVRQVGSIAELDSLFRRRQAPAHDPRTLMGIAPSRVGSAGLPTAEPTAVARSDNQEQSDSGEDDVTKVVRCAPEPPVPTPPVGVEIPAQARATPSEPDSDDITERPEAPAGATAPTGAQKARVLVEASAGEALPTPRSPTGPEHPLASGAVPTADSRAVRAGERPLPAEVPVGYGRYAETLRSEESLLSTASSAGSEHGSAEPSNGRAPGAKPIARITTQRVAVRRERPGASTMRSSDWADGSKGSPAGKAASDSDRQVAKAAGKASESSAVDSAEPAEPQKVGAMAEEPREVAAEPQKVDVVADQPHEVAVEPPQVGVAESPAVDSAEPAEPQKVGFVPDQPQKVDVEPPQVDVTAAAENVGVAADTDAAPVAGPAADTAAETTAPSRVADAAAELAAATAAGAPAVPESPQVRPAERAPQARENAKDVPHTTADESPAAAPAEARQKSAQAAARDAKKPSPSTERRPRPVSAEPAALGDRQRRRAPTAGSQPHRPRAWIGFAVAIAALAGAAYLSSPIWLPPAPPTARTASGAASGTDLDARLGHARRLIDEGDLAAAKQQLDSALALSDKDARVLVETARWHVQTAELAWWRSRMYDAADGTLAKAARQDLKAKLASAEAAVARAGSVGQFAPELRWARPALDRMSGDLAAARQHTMALAQSGWIAPEYAQASLAVAAGSSDWAMAARQLDKAASVETSLGPSRFGLIFVLASSARLDEARAQLNATARQPATEALFQELEAFLQKSSASATTTPDAGATSDAATAESAAAPDRDFRRQLTTANDALRAGQLTRAERLYRAVLDTVPGDTEALSGLADVARARNDSASALQLYQRVLESNPGYLPALMAVADQKRQSGDRQGASAYYRRVLEQAGTTSSYGTRASQRLREMETSAVSGRVADAGQNGTQRPGEVAARPSPSRDNASHETAKPIRDAGAQPSGRSPSPRRTGSPNPKDFVP